MPAGGGDSASPPSTGVLDATSIATKVDAAVVDVTSILPQQGAVAEGTGMVITSSGEVLTNNHVIDGATRITVKIGGSGRAYTAKVLGADAGEDIALLQIEGVSGLQTVTIGESSAVTVGDAVVAIGNALGRGGTPLATQGVVTSLDRTITASDSTGGRETLSGLIEINALIEPGDSGGPLVDSSGDVIGINTAAEVGGRFMRQTRSTAGFAIPISTAMSIVHQIEASSRV